MHWATAILVVVFVLPYLFVGGNAYIRLHDTLEGEWMWLKLLADSHTAFDFSSSAIIPQQMKGLPRNAFPPGLTVNMVLVQWLGLYKAYLLSAVLIHTIGFTGMLVLLRTYIVKQAESQYIVWGCALTFAVLPMFVPFGLSVMGQPCLLWAVLNLLQRRKLLASFAIIGLFPFYASIVWVLVPFGLLIGGIGLYHWYSKGFSWYWVVGGLLLLLMFVVVNFPMLNLHNSNPELVSHRTAYDMYMFDKPNFISCFTDFAFTFLTVHYHVGSFAPLVCLMAFGIVVRPTDKLMIAIFATIVVICLYQGFYSYIEYFLSKLLPFISNFRFNRFNILLPPLWIILFALVLDKMRQSTLLKPMVMMVILAQLFVAVMGNDEVLHNYRTMMGQPKFPAYNNYLAPKQFAEIKNYIGKPQSSYYVASFGMSPTIAQYNGFYTLDGLASIYDLGYKQRFRQIFIGEIEKSHEVQQYFDGWGNRCYIFSAELGTKMPAYSCYKDQHKVVEHFYFNAKAFKDLGGRYLISAVEIKNYKEQGLALESIFDDSESWWRIYLYSVKQD